MLSSVANARHLLLLFIREPIDGVVMRELAESVGAREACLRYQALCLTLLQQLVGLKETRIRFCIDPADGVEAVQFWILPELEGDVTALDKHLFLFTPHKAAPPIELEFIPQVTPDRKAQIYSQQTQGFIDGYETVSLMGSGCPDCGARWLHMAQLLCQSKLQSVVGTCPKGSLYLSTTQSPKFFQRPPLNKVQKLPSLPKIKAESDWVKALDSPIGGKIAKHFRRLRGSND